MFEFKIKKTYKRARTGFLNTPHGRIETPNLAIVATHGKIKLLNKTDHRRANPDLLIANTFHLFVNNKVKEIKKAGGLHQWLGFKKPIMTDSGGFQVFSLGWAKVHNIGKVVKTRIQPQKVRSSRDLTPQTLSQISKEVRSRKFNSFNMTKSDLLKNTTNNWEARFLGSQTPQLLNNVEIFEKGVIFNYEEKKFELTPEKSIKIQQDLGSDIIFVFDECTSPFNSYTYTKKAMERTHRWAIRCLEVFKTNSQKSKANNCKQALFGIVQGGIFEELRRRSSRFIGSLPFDGFGIGGSFGERQMKNVLQWALSGLPEEKPCHLLGIGKIKDIFIAVKQGIDLFDCVVPTREARHGVLYTKAGKLTIKKRIFAKDKKLIERGCDCWVCRQGISRQEIHHLFKTRINADNKQINTENIRVNPRLNQCKSASRAKRLATIHNIYFFKNLFREIREAISEGKLEKLEKMYYNYM